MKVLREATVTVPGSHSVRAGGRFPNEPRQINNDNPGA